MTNININYLTEAEHRKEAEFTRLLEELDELKKENRRLEKELDKSREPYDYREAVKADVLDALSDYDFKDYETLEDLEQVLNNDLWTCDYVTGNASGSYFCNSWKAESCLCHNMDLLAEAAAEFCGDLGEWVERGAEYCDVSIRCYLLGGAIAEALEEIEDDFNAAHETE